MVPGGPDVKAVLHVRDILAKLIASGKSDKSFDSLLGFY